MFSTMFFALTLGGAIWVGVVAARRIRDWGDMGRMLEANPDGGPQALMSAPGSSQAEARGRIRALVAERLDGQLQSGTASTGGRGVDGRPRRNARDAVGGDPVLDVRVGDVVLVELADQAAAGDYVVEGVLQLREGATERRVVVGRDGSVVAWLVFEPARNVVVVATPIEGHGWSGEPARNLKVEDRRYSLERRGQSSAYGLGVHGRPNQSRVATYLYRSLDGQVLWLERWGQEIVAATGHEVPAHGVRILQGS